MGSITGFGVKFKTEIPIMAKFPTDYTTAYAEYPEAVLTVMTKIQSGKSKHKDLPPEEFEWFYTWAETIKSYRVSDIISGKISNPYNYQHQNSLEERVKRRLANVFPGLEARKQRCSAGARTNLIPRQIIEVILKEEHRKMEIQSRIQKRSDGERREYFQQNLEKLVRSQGKGDALISVQLSKK